MKQLVFGSMLALLLAANLQAADVSVKGAHLCCGACTKAVATALGKVDGVSDAACDREAKTITFTAADDKTATAGLRALARAGFYGKASSGDKALKFPGQKVKEGTKADSVAVRGVHLCCGGCVKSAGEALKGVAGVEDVACDQKKRTVTASGSGISVAAVLAALRKEGFGGRTGGKPKKK